MGYFALAKDDSLQAQVQNVIDNCELFLRNLNAQGFNSFRPMSYLLDNFALLSLEKAIERCHAIAKLSGDTPHQPFSGSIEVK